MHHVSVVLILLIHISWCMFVLSLVMLTTALIVGISDLYGSYRSLFYRLFLSLFDMTMQTSVFIGAVIGAILSAILFICVPWYHSMIMWQLTHIWYLLPCAFIGAAVAAATD